MYINWFMNKPEEPGVTAIVVSLWIDFENIDVDVEKMAVGVDVALMLKDFDVLFTATIPEPGIISFPVI